MKRIAIVSGLVSIAAAAQAAAVMDFTSIPGWRVDFGKFTDARDAREQFRQDSAGAHVLIDRTRDDGNGYGAICGYGPGRVVFTSTNRLVRLTVKAPPRSPIGRGVKLRFMDGEGEVMQWSPIAVNRVGDRWHYDFNIRERCHDGSPNGTWGGRRRNGGKWDGKLFLWEINWDWGRATAGEIVFEKLEEIAEPSVARNVTARHPAMPMITGKDRYWNHDLRVVETNDALEVTLYGKRGYFTPVSLPPGPNRLFGAEEYVLRLSKEVAGGHVMLAMRNERTKKVSYFTRPWTREIRFPAKLSYSEAYYLGSITFSKPDKTPPVTFTVTGLDSIERRTEAEALDFDVETGSPLHLVNLPSHRPVARLENLTAETRRWTGLLRVTDFSGVGTDLPFAHTFAPGAVLRIPLAMPEKFGHYRVTCLVKGADGTEVERESAFARLVPREVTPQWPDGIFRFGVNYHIARYSDIDRALTQDAMVAIGCKLSRSDLMSPSMAFPKEGVYDWQRSDQLLGELEQHGISLDAIIYATPDWARTEKLRISEVAKLRRLYCAPMRPGLYRTFCEKLAARYGRRVAYYEIGNEWDLTDPKVLSVEDAIEMQREAYYGLHKGCPDAVCIPNGWACPLSSRHPTMRDDFQRRFISEARDAYDVYAIHLHGWYDGYARSLREILKYREREGLTHPWYSNETAMTGVNGAEDAVAVTVWKKIVFAWAHGSTDYIWYNLRGTGFDPLDGEQGFGLMTGDYYPRPSMAAFSGLVDAIGRLRPAGLPADGDSRLIARGEGMRNGAKVVAFVGWDRVTSEKVPIRVRTDAKRAFAVDLMGNRTPVPAVAGALVWGIRNEPCALLLEDVSRAEIDSEDAARPVTPAVRSVKVAAAFPAEPQFALDGFAQVVELFQADPAHAHRTWKGKEDLSARVWLAGDAKGLRVRAEVKDDSAAPGDALVVCIKPASGAIAKVTLSAASRNGTITRYEATLDPKRFGIQSFADCRIGAVVREDDGEGCDGWMESAENLGDLSAQPVLPRLIFGK